MVTQIYKRVGFRVARIFGDDWLGKDQDNDHLSWVYR